MTASSQWRRSPPRPTLLESVLDARGDHLSALEQPTVLLAGPTERLPRPWGIVTGEFPDGSESTVPVGEHLGLAFGPGTGAAVLTHPEDQVPQLLEAPSRGEGSWGLAYTVWVNAAAVRFEFEDGTELSLPTVEVPEADVRIAAAFVRLDDGPANDAQPPAPPTSPLTQVSTLADDGSIRESYQPQELAPQAAGNRAEGN